MTVVVAFFMGIVNIFCVILSARYASRRTLYDHKKNEEELFTQFRLDVNTQLEKINSHVQLVESNSVNWKALMDFGVKIENSIERVHEKREELQNQIMESINGIKEGMQELSVSVAEIKGRQENN